MKINLALDRLPAFRGRAAQAPGPEHRGTIHLGASDLDALDAAFEAARAGARARAPAHRAHAALGARRDARAARPPRRVAVRAVRSVRRARRAWPALRDALADRACAQVDEVAPGFTASILHREVLAPPDLERVFGLSGGNLFHGAMSPDRLSLLRPLPGWARYATPIRGPLPVRRGHPPGRRRDGRLRAQRGARDPAPPLDV